MIQVLGDALRKVGTIPAPLGFRHCRSPAISPQQGVRGRGPCSCRRHLATAVASQERFPGCATPTSWRGSSVWRPRRASGQRGGARLNSLCTCGFGVGVGVDGCWAWDSGSDAPSRQASPRHALEHYFHAVVAATEQMASEPSPSREGHLERLEEIYCSLLGPAAAARGRCSSKWRDDEREQQGRGQVR